MHRIVTLAPPGTPLFELGTPARLFGAARDAQGEQLYDVRIVAADGTDRVRTQDGQTMLLADGLDALDGADTVVIASSEQLLEPASAAALAARIRPRLLADGGPHPGLRIASICSGAFLLGALGLLEGRGATTHWRHAELLARRHPGARLRPEELFVQDGPVLSSAGVAAGIDLCLHMIRTDHGARIANQVARACIVAPVREGGQAQYIDAPIGRTADAATTAGLAAWLLQNLDLPHTTASMAARAHMSTRTFERRFRAEHGTTPGRWLIAARIRRAKEHLETTDRPVDRIAHAVGLGTAATLRGHFRRSTGQSPQAYRRAFRPGSTDARTLEASPSMGPTPAPISSVP